MQAFESDFHNWMGLLRCFICQRTYQTPHTITECGHSFCLDCIEGPLGKDTKCPQCGLPARPKNLRKSTFLSNVLQWAAKIQDLLVEVSLPPETKERSKKRKSVSPILQRSSPTKYRIQQLLHLGIFTPSCKVTCFDCKARITSRATLKDEIDRQEYDDLDAWATYVGRLVKNPRLPRQRALDVIYLDGKTIGHHISQSKSKNRLL